MVDVVLPVALRRLELDDVSGQIGVAVVGGLPREFYCASGFVQNLKKERDSDG